MIKLSFIIPGHTKFPPEQCFGLNCEKGLLMHHLVPLCVTLKMKIIYLHKGIKSFISLQWTARLANTMQLGTDGMYMST